MAGNEKIVSITSPFSPMFSLADEKHVKNASILKALGQSAEDSKSSEWKGIGADFGKKISEQEDAGFLTDSVGESVNGTQDMSAENQKLTIALNVANASLVKHQEQNGLMEARENLLLRRINELEEEVRAQKNECRHLKRQLNDKSVQASAAQEREYLLIQLLERCENEKSALREQLEAESSRNDDEGNGEAIAKLEDMLESLLALGEQEQAALNAKLVKDNESLNEILGILQEVEMKQLYQAYFSNNQTNDTDFNTNHHITYPNDSLERSRVPQDDLLKSRLSHETEDHSNPNDFAYEKSHMHPPAISGSAKMEIPSSSTATNEEMSKASTHSLGHTAAVCQSVAATSPKKGIRDSTQKAQGESTHKKSKWPTPRWMQSRSSLE